jgi:hypothetical protein
MRFVAEFVVSSSGTHNCFDIAQLKPYLTKTTFLNQMLLYVFAVVKFMSSPQMPTPGLHDSVCMRLTEKVSVSKPQAQTVMRALEGNWTWILPQSIHTSATEFAEAGFEIRRGVCSVAILCSVLALACIAVSLGVAHS